MVAKMAEQHGGEWRDGNDAAALGSGQQHLAAHGLAALNAPVASSHGVQTRPHAPRFPVPGLPVPGPRVAVDGRVGPAGTGQPTAYKLVQPHDTVVSTHGRSVHVRLVFPMGLTRLSTGAFYGHELTPERARALAGRLLEHAEKAEQAE